MADRAAQDVQGWGDPEDPIVLLIGAPESLFADWRRSVRALVEAGRRVVVAPAASEDEARIQALADERTAAKKSRDFARADAIRDQLAAEGIALEDTPQGVRWKRT